MKQYLAFLGILFFVGVATVACNSTVHRAKAGNNVDPLAKINDTARSIWPKTLKARIWNAAFIMMDTLGPSNSVSRLYHDSAIQTAKKLMSLVMPISIGRKKYWIVEGDILMSRDDIYQYVLRRIQRKLVFLDFKYDVRTLTMGGIGPENKQYDQWPPNTTIHYSVLSKSFGDHANYLKIVSRMNMACNEWMGLCNVKFKYEPALDLLDTSMNLPNNLDFVVQEINIHDRFYATSFYPHDPDFRHRLYIDPSYFACPYDSVGVFRHEIGHILGFRHEQIWSKDEECQGEEVIENNIGGILIDKDYDPNSVMHYACGSEGTHGLRFTKKDTTGAVFIYGASVTGKK